MFDILVVGCGLSGAVIARYFAEKGKKVMIWERRNHIAGNMYDYIDDYGILVQKYGPHIFHTNQKGLYDYICRFGKWNDFRLIYGAVIDGICTPTPFNFQTIDDFYSEHEAKELKNRINTAFADRQTATVLELLEHTDPIICAYAKFLFEKDYSIYTAKQWGISASQIDPSVLKRVPLRFSYEMEHFDDTYQVMPQVSYTAFFENLLVHKNIKIELGIDALKHLSVADNGESLLIDGVKTEKTVVYTGALDELFGLCEGALPYRSLRFEWRYERIDSFQDMPIIAYPQAPDYTRITEYKKLPVQDVFGTTYAVEYPLSYVQGQGNEPYYPVLTDESNKQYEIYRKKAKQISNLYPCGRLADFKYYNMDQTLHRAIMMCREIGV